MGAFFMDREVASSVLVIPLLKIDLLQTLTTIPAAYGVAPHLVCNDMQVFHFIAP